MCWISGSTQMQHLHNFKCFEACCYVCLLMSPSCTSFSFASVFWFSVGLLLQVCSFQTLSSFPHLPVFHTHLKMSLRFIFSPRQSLQNTSKTVIAVWRLKSISRPWDAFTAQLDSSREAGSYLERSRWCVRKHCINLEISGGTRLFLQH